jgi:hypothetical protein
MHALEAARRWRSARLSAIRRYGAGQAADAVAAAAVKRFFKRIAKRGTPAALPRNVVPIAE